MRDHQFKRRALSALVAVAAAAIATSASAARYPTEHRYLTKPLQICDQGIFTSVARPKVTPFVRTLRRAHTPKSSSAACLCTSRSR